MINRFFHSNFVAFLIGPRLSSAFLFTHLDVILCYCETSSLASLFNQTLITNHTHAFEQLSTLNIKKVCSSWVNLCSSKSFSNCLQTFGSRLTSNNHSARLQKKRITMLIEIKVHCLAQKSWQWTSKLDIRYNTCPSASLISWAFSASDLSMADCFRPSATLISADLNKCHIALPIIGNGWLPAIKWINLKWRDLTWA